MGHSRALAHLNPTAAMALVRLSLGARLALQPRSRLAFSAVPARSLQRSLSPSGSGWAGSVNALSHAAELAPNRARKRFLISSINSRFRLVSRTTNSPRTVQGASASSLALTDPSFPSSPRRAAPTSSNQFQISTTISSRVARRASATSIDRERTTSRSIAISGIATQPPADAIWISALCRRRCSMSRGRPAHGACSRKPTSCSPTAAATIPHVSIEAEVPRPSSRSLISVCERAAWAATCA